jgi:hypothetical protein
MEKLKAALKKGFDYTGNALFENKQFMELMGGMLEYDPERRMMPKEILESSFVVSNRA